MGSPGEFIGFDNYVWLLGDPVFLIAVMNTLVFTAAASVLNFAIGIYLALLLNKRLPFKALIRAIVLLP